MIGCTCVEFSVVSEAERERERESESMYVHLWYVCSMQVFLLSYILTECEQ